jgi:hypothetical protein
MILPFNMFDWDLGSLKICQLYKLTISSKVLLLSLIQVRVVRHVRHVRQVRQRERGVIGRFKLSHLSICLSGI